MDMIWWMMMIIKCTAKTLTRLGIRPMQADLSLRWAHMPIRWFCHYAAQINSSYFWKWRSGKNVCLLGYKLDYKLDFTKSLIYSNCQNGRKCLFLFFFVCLFLLFFSFMCHVCVLSLTCLFIISGEFDALHQLSVKKDALEIQHPKLENSRHSFIESVHEK